MESQANFELTAGTIQALKAGKSIDDALKSIAKLLPKAWQYPEHALAKITFDEKEFLSDEKNYKENIKWTQKQNFETIDHKKGSIEIYYLKDFPIKDEGPYLESERQLINNLANVISGFLNIIKDIDTSSYKEDIDKIIAEKIERQKELQCINTVTAILKTGRVIDDNLQQIVETIPPAYQFPEFASAKIVFDGKEYKSREPYIESEWKQEYLFSTINKKQASLTVYYSKLFPTLDEGPFLKEERHLIDNLGVLIQGYLNIVKGWDDFTSVQKGMENLMAEKMERLKELACINQTNSILKQGKGVEDTLRQLVRILPKAWQYPDFTQARICYDNMVFESPYFEESNWCMRQDFETIDDNHGSIEIYYSQHFPDCDEGPFLKEERDLIDNLAGMITNYLNTAKAKEILNKFRNNEKKTPQQQASKLSANSRQLLQKLLTQHNSNRDIYHDLMPFKVKEILIIATLYDAYSIEKEGRFTEHILGEYHQLNLSSLPRITGVSTLDEALEQLNSRHYDLIILMKGNVRSVIEITKAVNKKYSYVPIYLLLNNNSDISSFKNLQITGISQIFVWNGDSKVFFAMVKHLEDKVNVKKDTKLGLVRIILVVEDSEKYYSRYLPALYSSVMEQTKRLIEEVQSDDLYKLLRLRARPKVLLATTYEEAVNIFYEYKDSLLCLITDMKFPKEQKLDSSAGYQLVKYVKNIRPDLPTVIQSSNINNAHFAHELKASFINKNSETLLKDIQGFISFYLGFGSFNFKNAEGRKIAVAQTLKEFEELIQTIPYESLVFHGSRDHFSMWLMARGEIKMAKMINPVKVHDFASPDEFRNYMIHMLQKYRHEITRGKVVNFDESAIKDPTNIVSMGTGALGGKGRGLAFINTLIYNLDFSEILTGINIAAPKTFIIGTDEFDIFLDKNNLRDKVYLEPDYKKIQTLFLAGELSFYLQKRLSILLKLITAPVAIRSSSLFEDSMNQPFSGIFGTYLLPNNHENFKTRLNQTMDAIKLVYASIFSDNARNYFKAVNYKIEEEKMAIVIQEVVGKQIGNVFYPNISGTAQSHNYYPVAHMKPNDGFAVAAVGLGQYVVEGEKTYRFCPRHPKLDIISLKDIVKLSQVHFYAVDLTKKDFNLLDGESAGLCRVEIFDALKHGTIKHCASMYDHSNDRLEAGIDSPGTPVINFANILKHDYLPLAKTLDTILEVVRESLDSPVEIEYAVDISTNYKKPSTFYLLQIKPLLGNDQDYEINMVNIEKESIVLYAEKSMGNGKISDIQDVIYVKNSSFNKLRTEEMAFEIDYLNKKMRQENKKYVLIGPGRWGTRDKFIGIPVAWPQISNAKIIVEISLDDFPLDASLGSHFFHNVTSMNVGYFSIQNHSKTEFVSWQTLEKQEVIEETTFFKHIKFPNPLSIKMDGKKQISVISTQDDSFEELI